MRKISIISVGKSQKEYDALSLHWTKMIRFSIKEYALTPYRSKSKDEIKKYEASQILKYIDQKDVVIALHPLGREMDSHEFANLLNKVDGSYSIAFILGGAYGLDDSILDRASVKLSLSKMTMPHMFAKLMLLEQIYRAQTIIDGHPYHK